MVVVQVTGVVYERRQSSADGKSGPYVNRRMINEDKYTHRNSLRKRRRKRRKAISIRIVFGFALVILVVVLCTVLQLLKDWMQGYHMISFLKKIRKLNENENDRIMPNIRVNEEVLNGNNIQWILNKEKDNSMFISHSTYQHQHNTSTKIPKIIHKILITNDGKVPDIEDYSMNANLSHALNSWTRRNPGYNMKIYGLDDCKAYLNEHFHPVFLRTFNCIEAYAGKTNLCRAAIVYHEGGWYSDWMEEVQVDGLLDTLSTGNQTIVFPWAITTEWEVASGAIMNGFFGAQPCHPMLAETLKIIVLNVNREYYGEFAQESTGGGVMGRAYKKYYNDGMDAKKLSTFPILTGWYSCKYRPHYPIPEYRFTKIYGKTKVIEHKCGGCSIKKHYGTAGNDYRDLHLRKKYYCPQASSLLSSEKNFS